jgi:hypothetical protein
VPDGKFQIEEAEIEVDIDMALAEFIGESKDSKPQPTMLNRYLWRPLSCDQQS